MPLPRILGWPALSPNSTKKLEELCGVDIETWLFGVWYIKTLKLEQVRVLVTFSNPLFGLLSSHHQSKLCLNDILHEGSSDPHTSELYLPKLLQSFICTSFMKVPPSMDFWSHFHLPVNSQRAEAIAGDYFYH